MDMYFSARMHLSYSCPSKRKSIKSVGLSNILDREHGWRKPAKGPHGKVVGAAVMDRELLFKVCKGIKAVGRIETFADFGDVLRFQRVAPGAEQVQGLAVHKENCFL